MVQTATSRAKQRVAAVARRHPRVVSHVSRGLRRVGLEGVAARGERAADLARVVPDQPARPFHLLLCDGRDQVAREVSVEGWASFERPLPAVLARLVSRVCRGGLFVDVGANTGYYALLAWSVEPTVDVDAFEPYPPVLSLLRHNRTINGADRIRIRDLAVGAKPGTATLYVPLGDHGLVETSSSLNPTFDDTRIGQRIDVAVTTLDDEYPPGGQAPRVLKIDVESLEPEVLEGAADLIEQHRPILVLELLPHADPSRLEALRERWHYTDIRLRPDSAVIGGPVTPDADAWNHLWCSSRDLSDVRRLLGDVGLELMAGR